VCMRLSTTVDQIDTLMYNIHTCAFQADGKQKGFGFVSLSSREEFKAALSLYVMPCSYMSMHMTVNSCIHVLSLNVVSVYMCMLMAPMHAYLCMHVFLCVFVYYVHAPMYVCMYVCMYVYLHTTCMYLCVCVYIYIQLCIYVCM
jgi:hypothetical protein